MQTNLKDGSGTQRAHTRYADTEIPGFVADAEAIAEYVRGLNTDLHSVKTSSKIRDTIVIPEKFDYLCTDSDGRILAAVVKPDGTITMQEITTNKTPYNSLVTDGRGDSLVVTKDKLIMGIKEFHATGGDRVLLNDYHRKKDSAAVWCVNFKPYPKQEFAFDYLGSSDHGIFATDEYYPKSGNYAKKNFTDCLIQGAAGIFPDVIQGPSGQTGFKWRRALIDYFATSYYNLVVNIMAHKFEDVIID